MKWVHIILSDYIRRGKVTLEIPGLDAEELYAALHGEADATLRRVIRAAFSEETTDREKVAAIQALLI